MRARHRQLLLLVAGAGFGTIPVFVAALGQDGLSAPFIVTWRLLWGAPLLALIAAALDPASLRFRREDVLPAVGMGLLLDLSFLSYIGSLGLGTPVATAAFLAYTQPAFTLVLAWLWLREPPRATELAALGLALAGAALILGLAEGGLRNFDVGTALALLNGVVYAGYILWGRFRARSPSPPRPLQLTLGSFVAGALWIPLVLLYLGPGPAYAGIFLAVGGLSATAVGTLALMVVVATVLPYLFINVGLEGLRAARTGILLVVDPLVATGLAWWLLGQVPTWYQVAGGGLILAAVVLLVGFPGGETARPDAATPG